MEYDLVSQHITYTGEQLRSHWIRERFQLEGDAIVAFIGECNVTHEYMVDLADVASGQAIRARRMLHFIAEFFDTDLLRAVLRQRLLLALAAEQFPKALNVSRDGDDLYVGDRKLSVSVATVSSVSALLHLGLNIDQQGAPVPAIGLAELDLEPTAFAKTLMERYVRELDGVETARCKVRPVP